MTRIFFLFWGRLWLHEENIFLLILGEMEKMQKFPRHIKWDKIIDVDGEGQSNKTDLVIYLSCGIVP